MVRSSQLSDLELTEVAGGRERTLDAAQSESNRPHRSAFQPLVTKPSVLSGCFSVSDSFPSAVLFEANISGCIPAACYLNSAGVAPSAVQTRGKERALPGGVPIIIRRVSGEGIKAEVRGGSRRCCRGQSSEAKGPALNEALERSPRGPSAGTGGVGLQQGG